MISEVCSCLFGCIFNFMNSEIIRIWFYSTNFGIQLAILFVTNNITTWSVILTYLSFIFNLLIGEAAIVKIKNIIDALDTLRYDRKNLEDLSCDSEEFEDSSENSAENLSDDEDSEHNIIVDRNKIIEEFEAEENEDDNELDNEVDNEVDNELDNEVEVKKKQD